MRLKTIDSPYKILYWSMFNLVQNELGLEVSYKPSSPFRVEALKSLDGYPYISMASSRDLVSLLEEVQPLPPSYDYRRLIHHFKEVVERYQVSSKSYVVTEENYGYLKPSSYPYQVSFSIILMWFAFYLDVTTKGKYKLKIKGLSRYLAESSLFYYFKIFDYLKVDYELETKDIDVINSQLYVEMARYQGFMTQEVLTKTKKKEVFKEQGYQVGSIVFLYEKNYLSNSEVRSRVGENKYIDKVHLAKITKVTDTEVQFHLYNLFKTQEGLYEQYLALPEVVQQLYGSFEEFLEPSLTVSRTEVQWDMLGVGYAQSNNPTYAEHYFVTKVDSIYSVPLTVLDENLHFDLTTLSVSEATAYLLLAYQVDFDKDLFEKEYSVNLESLQKRVDFQLGLLEDLLGFSIRSFCKVQSLPS